MRALVVLLPLCAAGAVQAAELTAEVVSTDVRVGQFVTSPVRPDGGVTVRQVVDQPPVETTPDNGVAAAASRVIFLNRGAVTLSPGSNQSAQNRSSVVPSTVTIPAWDVSEARWTSVVDCVREVFAPFGAEIVTTAPAAGVRHVEALFGGEAGDAMDPASLPTNGTILGVSPFTIGCDTIEDSVVFTFGASADQLGLSARDVCEVAAQEIAHSFGLDHLLNASDPMTYLNYAGDRSFKDQATQCGEFSQRACGLQGECGATQNSYERLLEEFGPAADVPPDDPEPSDPSDPSEPADPSDPSDPSNPADPSDPTGGDGEAQQITGGCSTGSGASSGLGLVLVAMLAGLWVRRRRPTAPPQR